jgi:hypothetical protein
VGAVLGGLAAVAILSHLTDTILRATGVFPPFGQPMGNGLFALATFYRAVYSVLGCALTARLAPDRPMRHALALGGLGMLISVVGGIATWGRGPEFGPHWYPLLLAAISFPCAWVGGRIGGRQG